MLQRARSGFVAATPAADVRVQGRIGGPQPAHLLTGIAGEEGDGELVAGLPEDLPDGPGGLPATQDLDRFGLALGHVLDGSSGPPPRRQARIRARHGLTAPRPVAASSGSHDRAKRPNPGLRDKRLWTRW